MDNGTRQSSGDFLPFAKIGDFSSAIAIMIEPLGYRLNVPGKFGIRNIVDARLTLFFTEEELRGEADPIVKEVAFDKIPATRDLIDRMEDDNYEPSVVKAVYLPATPDKNAFWCWRKVDNAIFDLVAAYKEKMDNFEPEWA